MRLAPAPAEAGLVLRCTEVADLPDVTELVRHVVAGAANSVLADRPDDCGDVLVVDGAGNLVAARVGALIGFRPGAGLMIRCLVIEPSAGVPGGGRG